MYDESEVLDKQRKDSLFREEASFVCQTLPELKIDGRQQALTDVCVDILFFFFTHTSS